MIAATIFIVFFLVLYLTRPNRKKRRMPKITPPKAELEQLRQQAMGNFWVQALAQSLPKQQRQQTSEEPEAVAIEPGAAIEPENETTTQPETIRPAPQQDTPVLTNQTSEQTDTYAAFVQYLKAFEDQQKGVSIQQPATPTPVSLPKTKIAAAAMPDSSVIDIPTEVRAIPYDPDTEDDEDAMPEGLTAYLPGVPHWAHHYVYSGSEIRQANHEQQYFYRQFKTAFLSGVLYDIGENSNYAFVLYFDLIEDYRKHQDIQKLEKQFNKLEQICDRVGAYSGTFLVKELRDRGLSGKLMELEGSWSTLRNDRPSYLNWDWRSLYQQKMKLTEEEASLLEPVYLSSGAFMNIDFICRQTIRLYLELVKTLFKAYRDNGTDKQKEFHTILDVVARKLHRYHAGSPNYTYIVEHDSQLYAYILRYAESALRAYYGYNRKLQIEGYLDHPEVKAILQEKILNHLEPQTSSFYRLLEPIDDVNEIELNAISPARWRSQLEQAVIDYQNGEANSLEHLVNLNQKNPSKDLLLYEISRTLITSDKAAALSWYFRHAFQCKLDKKVWKLPTAAMNKQLFKTPQDSERFYSYFNEFHKAPDLTQALQFAKTFYQPVRKKIAFDTHAIQQAETLDNRTTELLSAYLVDEEPEKPNQPEAIAPEITQDQEPQNYPATVPGLSAAALALIQAIAQNQFSLSITDAEAICVAYGQMASPLINSINEACYDLLDDNLIETAQGHYHIQPEYYHQIIHA